MDRGRTDLSLQLGHQHPGITRWIRTDGDRPQRVTWLDGVLAGSHGPRRNGTGGVGVTTGSAQRKSEPDHAQHGQRQEGTAPPDRGRDPSSGRPNQSASYRVGYEREGRGGTQPGVATGVRIEWPPMRIRFDRLAGSHQPQHCAVSAVPHPLAPQRRREPGHQRRPPAGVTSGARPGDRPGIHFEQMFAIWSSKHEHPFDVKESIEQMFASRPSAGYRTQTDVRGRAGGPGASGVRTGSEQLWHRY